jgi:hypothetical protein
MTITYRELNPLGVNIKNAPLTNAELDENFFTLEGTKQNSLDDGVGDFSIGFVKTINGQSIAGQGNIAASSAPVGSIVWMHPSASIPAGFLVCDGSYYNQGDYPNLASVIGGNYIPDLIGKFIIGTQVGSQQDSPPTSSVYLNIDVQTLSETGMVDSPYGGRYSTWVTGIMTGMSYLDTGSIPQYGLVPCIKV